MDVDRFPAYYFPDVLQIENQVFPIFDCQTTGVGSVLRVYGYESVLPFMLCRNVNFYWYLEAGRLAYGCQLFPLFCDLEVQDGLHIHAYRYTDGEAALARMRRDLDGGIPHMIEVDEYFIPDYHGFGRQHTLHATLVVGHEAGHVYLNDLGVLRRIEEPVFCRALALSHYTLFSFVLPPHRVHYDAARIRRLIGKNVRLGLDTPALNDAPAEWLAGSMDTRLNVGLGVAAIRRFAEDLPGLVLDLAPDRRQVVLSMLGTHTYDIIVQRHWHALFCHSAAAILPDGAVLEDLTEAYLSIAQQWKVVRNLFHKASVRGPARLLPRIAKRLLDLADTEEHLLTTMRGLVRESCR